MNELIKNLAGAMGEMPRHTLLKVALKALEIRQEDVAVAKGLDAGYLRHILNGRQNSDAYLNAVEEYVMEALTTSQAA